jgi:predicted regulator of Ras-like GTPase activity (Roadblock/LC7/MglB family)
MLSAKAVNAALKQTLGNGVEYVVLVNSKGSLLSSATTELDSEKATTTTLTLVTVAGNLWRSYSTNDLALNKNVLEPESLEAILVDLGETKVCALSVGGSGILLLAGHQVELGLLKLKASGLQRYLDPQLRSVMKN